MFAESVKDIKFTPLIIQNQEDDYGNEGSLAIKVWVPPVGKGHFYNMNYNIDTGEKVIRDEVEYVDILNGTAFKPNVPDKDCMWKKCKPQRPTHYKNKVAQEARRREKDKDYFDPELKAYHKKEWHRRRFGVWFWNYNSNTQKTELEYVIGPHYFYLCHWMLDTGLPSFRKSDQEYYFFRRFVEENPACTGMLEATRRRAGKTYRGGEFVFEYTSRNGQAHGGMQSKTETDAKINVFRKAVVEPFRKLIEVFKPTYDKSKGERPTKEISFFNTNQRGHVKEEVDGALESWIDWMSSDPISYDGHKLSQVLA